MLDTIFEELKRFWLLVLLIVFGILIYQVDAIVLFAYKVFLALLPIGATILLGYLAHFLWLSYVQNDFITGIDWVLLEIIPPRDVPRSPRAMELFITNALYHFSDKGGVETYWQGAVWFWFSLEIVSIEGQVHFYIRVPTRVRQLVETQMYGQFPQAKIVEADDYTLAIDGIYDGSKYDLWGCEFAYVKPDVFPIKTYVDYGLDKDQKEEYKVDPISPVVELFSSIGKGEQMWLQIVVTPSKKKYKHSPNWLVEGERVLREFVQGSTRTNKSEDPLHPIAKGIRPPDFVQDLVKRSTAKMFKVGFDTGIRACYVAEREVFNQNKRRELRLIFRQYASPYGNELKRINSTQGDAFATGVFSGFFLASATAVTRLKDRMLVEYSEREFFHPPIRHRIKLPWPISPYIFPNYFHHHINVMNTEELATLWHFPGQILSVPNLERIESKEASPPPNLPT